MTTYLLNDWRESGIAPVLIFTGIFVVGYLLIWAVIYSVIKRDTIKLNESLKKGNKAYKTEKPLQLHPCGDGIAAV